MFYLPMEIHVDFLLIFVFTEYFVVICVCTIVELFCVYFM